MKGEIETKERMSSMHHPITKYMAVCLAIIVVALGLCTGSAFSVAAQPEGGGHAPYTFSLDKLHTSGGSASMIRVFRNMSLEMGESMEAEGWLATPEGVSGYVYAWIPTGGGPVSWMPVSDLHIGERPDLVAAGVPHASGHSTAGFRFTLTPPEGTEEGYYDVYVRALDGMGVACDMAVILNLKYGRPDDITDSGRVISFSRIAAEGDEALVGDAKITEENIILPPDGGIRLGDIPLSAYETLRITYSVIDDSVSDDRTPILGLKSSGRYSYGKDGEKYNLTDSLAFSALSTTSDVMEIDLTDCLYNGEVWLTGHLDRKVVITSLEFISVDYGGDRVAAKIYLSEGIFNYFSSNNHADVYPVEDPKLGDVVRMQVRDETNDPYVYFSAGALLREYDLGIDAREYKYMVLLARSLSTNPYDTMVFYLCAGTITGATEACTARFSMKRDNQWHYYVVDLTKTENWTGIINGMRFDFLSGNLNGGEAVEFASVQFFRTREAAAAAAAQKPGALGPYDKDTDPAVFPDMVEEVTVESGTFTPAPEDTYVVTEPETEPVTEPATQPTEIPETDPVTDNDSSETKPSDTESADTAPPAGKGCRSALPVAAVLPVLAVIPFAYSKRRSRFRNHEK